MKRVWRVLFHGRCFSFGSLLGGIESSPRDHISAAKPAIIRSCALFRQGRSPERCAVSVLHLPTLLVGLLPSADVHADRVPREAGFFAFIEDTQRAGQKAGVSARLLGPHTHECHHGLGCQGRWGWRHGHILHHHWHGSRGLGRVATLGQGTRGGAGHGRFGGGRAAQGTSPCNRLPFGAASGRDRERFITNIKS